MSKNLDGTPLSVIQEQVFQETQRRKQEEHQQRLRAIQGPPPDIEQFAAVGGKNGGNNNNVKAAPAPVPLKASGAPAPAPTPAPVPTTNVPTSAKVQQNSQQNKSSDFEPISTAVPALHDDATQAAVQRFRPSPLEYSKVERSTIANIQIFFSFVLVFFLCLYIYPIMQKTPNEKRMTASRTLLISVLLGGVCMGIVQKL